LISEDVRIYFLDLKQMVDLTNYSSYFCYHPSNSVLVKTMTGDSSDSIKGIKGLGQDKLLSLFPELKTQILSLNEIIDKAKKQQQERIDNKKKPLKVLDNIINKVTDGPQKEMIYEINNRLVNLNTPMMTEDAIRELQRLNDGKLTNTDRDLKNVMAMMKRDGLDKAIGETRYPDYLIPFKKLIEREDIF